MRTTLFLGITAASAVCVETINDTTTEETSRNELILGHFTVVAAIVIVAATILTAACTILACSVDFGNLKKGVGNLEVCDEEHEELWPVHTRPTRSNASAQQILDEDITDLTGDAAKLADLDAEAVQISKVTPFAPRLDAQAKQARIIEAIYQASGREVPEMYRSKTRSQEKLPVPDSPVTSPSRFAVAALHGHKRTGKDAITDRTEATTQHVRTDHSEMLTTSATVPATTQVVTSKVSHHSATAPTQLTTKSPLPVSPGLEMAKLKSDGKKTATGISQTQPGKNVEEAKEQLKTDVTPQGSHTPTAVSVTEKAPVGKDKKSV